jgi:predicted AAA+ superfamily ATPase
MIKRDIFQELERSLSSKQVIVITGIRRVGKTTALKYLMDKLPLENRIYYDLERVENRAIFNEQNFTLIIEAIKSHGLDLSKKAYICIDEIQLVQKIPSVIKFLYDTYDIKFIVTGSSSYYIKNYFTESLAGRKRIFEMTTLSFREFLRFRGQEDRLAEASFINVNPYIYNGLITNYREYLEFGGFPEVVLASSDEDKEWFLKDIMNSYMNIDIKFLADFSKSDELYRIIRLLTSRTGSKIDFTKLSNISGIGRKKISEYLLFFEETFLLKTVPAFVQNRDREIALQRKIYFTDNGLIRILGNQSPGVILENAVANQLSRHGKLQYYARRSGQEIDFILDEKIAIEVKETPGIHDLRVLQKRAAQIGLNECYLIGLNLGNKDFTGFTWAGSV